MRKNIVVVAVIMAVMLVFGSCVTDRVPDPVPDSVPDPQESIEPQPVIAYGPDDTIFFSVTSDYTTGTGWIKRFEKKGFRLGRNAESVLHSRAFKPTSGVTTEIAVLKGYIFKDRDRTAKNLRAEAASRGLSRPNVEVACLIREKFSNREIKAMGLYWIVTMHKSLEDDDGDSGLLVAHRYYDRRWLHIFSIGFGDGWPRDGGFAFVVPQAGP